MTISLHLGGEIRRLAEPLVERLVDEHFATRLGRKDPTLWGAQSETEAARRLGWVDPFTRSASVLDLALSIRDELRARSIDDVVLCGMGGSSLGPEVVAREAGVPLTVLDSTHPAEVRRALDRDLSRTAVVISSKSGSTLETLSHEDTFRRAFLEAGLDPTEHIIYVTDPGTTLEARRGDGYRVVLADPEVGGRFSVLTAFGIVPTVLAGADLGRVLTEAQAVASSLLLDTHENPALRLAAAIAAGIPRRFVLLLSEANGTNWGLGDWIEQLVAESTGKEGHGVLPVSLPLDAPELIALPESAVSAVIGGTAAFGDHELAVDAPLGAQLYLWEVATAAVGYLLGINPFDQPDVESAKIAARDALTNEDGGFPGELPEADPDELAERFRTHIPPGGYLAVLAFVDRRSPAGAAARALRTRLARELGVPVSLGWGPRYLHSTGQLHKGGPARGAYLQIVDLDCEEFGIPGTDWGFGALMRAQARGDREVLESRGRAVLTRRIRS